MHSNKAKFTYSPLGKLFNDGLNKKNNTKKKEFCKD